MRTNRFNERRWMLENVESAARLSRSVVSCLRLSGRADVTYISEVDAFVERIVLVLPVLGSSFVRSVRSNYLGNCKVGTALRMSA